MVFAVVPTDALAFTFHESEEWRGLLGMLLSPLHLGIEPTSRDDGCGLQELERATALHLATDDACQVVLDGQDVDGDDFVLIDHKLEDALEGLRFLTLPMELLTDCNIVESERTSLPLLRPERQFLIDIVSPTNAAIRIFSHLLARHLRSFRMIRTVHAEANGRIFHDADGNFLIHGWQVVLLLLVLRNSLFRLVRQLNDDGFQFLFAQGYFLQDGLSLLCRQSLEILLSWRNEEAAHIQGSRTYEQLLLALGIIAIGTMFAAREDERHNLVRPTGSAFLTPTNNVQTRFRFVANYRQSLIDTLAEQTVAFGWHAANHEDWASVTLQQIESATTAHIACLFHRSRLLARQGIELAEALLVHRPIAFQRHNSPASGLQMHMVRARSPAKRTVVEDDVFGHIPSHLPEGSETAIDALRRVSAHRNGEVLRQDGIRVDENLIMLLRHEFVLLLGAIVVAKEARPFADGLLVDGSASTYNSGGIPLSHE